jgi:hypothetical protein
MDLCHVVFAVATTAVSAPGTKATSPDGDHESPMATSSRVATAALVGTSPLVYSESHASLQRAFYSEAVIRGGVIVGRAAFLLSLEASNVSYAALPMVGVKIGGDRFTVSPLVGLGPAYTSHGDRTGWKSALLLRAEYVLAKRSRLGLAFEVGATYEAYETLDVLGRALLFIAVPIRMGCFYEF